MKMRFAALMLAASLPLLSAHSAPKKQSAPTCPAEVQLPPALADWRHPAENETIYADGDGNITAWLPLGAARTRLPLHKFESLRYSVAPDREPNVFLFGGMVPIEVKKAGKLTVALDSGAWIDLVRDGHAQKSVSHGHGPACSGIRKMVDFDVTPGRYLLQIVNAPTATIHAMAVLKENPAP